MFYAGAQSQMRAKVKVPAKSNNVWTVFLGTALQLYTYLAECVLLTVIQFRNSRDLVISVCILASKTVQ